MRRNGRSGKRRSKGTNGPPVADYPTSQQGAKRSSTPDRLDQAGLLGSCCRIWRTASSSPARIVSAILQRGLHLPSAGQGCAGFAGGSDSWQHRRQAAPGRIAPSIRPDLISGRNTGEKFENCCSARARAGQGAMSKEIHDKTACRSHAAHGATSSLDACVADRRLLAARRGNARRRNYHLPPRVDVAFRWRRLILLRKAPPCSLFLRGGHPGGSSQRLSLHQTHLTHIGTDPCRS
jgi:hypothetical protein